MLGTGCALAVAVPATARAERQVGAGGGEGAWIVVGDRSVGIAVQHLPASDPGVSERAFGLPNAPRLIGVGGGRLVLLYEIGGDLRGPAPSYHIREVVFSRPLPSRPLAYGAQAPLAPPPAGEEFESILVLDREVHLLGRRSLLTFEGREWSRRELPALIGDGARLLEVNGRAAIIDPSARSTLIWTTGGSGPGAGWSSRALAGVEGSIDLLRVGDQLIAGTHADGSVVFGLVRDAGVFEIARLRERGPHRWIVPVGEHLGVIWSDGGSSPRLDAVILSTSGRVIHDGPVRSMSPVSARDLEVLVVLLASTVLSVVVFIIRPALVPRRAIRIPEGWWLAESWRRAIAGAIDLLIGLIASSAFWSIRIDEMTNPASERFAELGVWPLLGAAAVAIILSGLGEAVAGRTPGKALVGIRTITFDGRRPGVLLSIFRNGVKILCPPLAVISLLGVPPEASPTSMGTLVIARRPELQAGDSDESQGQEGDDR